jgi:hypothetical protein
MMSFTLFNLRITRDMLMTRNAVIEDAFRVGSFFESLARHTIASKQLSAASNTVLMLVASLHATLCKSNEQSWYTSFRKQIADFCGKNSRAVYSSLMLRSRIMALHACCRPFWR